MPKTFTLHSNGGGDGTNPAIDCARARVTALRREHDAALKDCGRIRNELIEAEATYRAEVRLASAQAAA